jgi:hypothetical protein
MSDDKNFSALLSEWQPTIEPGSGFQRGVWSRIETAECRRNYFQRVVGWLDLFARPHIAFAALAVAFLGGGFLGRLQTKASHQERYLDSLRLFAANSNVR